MNVPSGLLPGGYLWLANVVYALVLGYALYRAPWGRLASGSLQNVFVGAAVFVALLWHLDVGISPGVSLHYLGATSVALMFGWQLGVVAVSLAMVAHTFFSPAGWEAFAINALAVGVIPVLVSYGLHVLVRDRLPHNFFVYLFLGAFLGGALSMVASTFVTYGVMAGSGLYASGQLTTGLLGYLPLMMFPEAFINGLLITTLVMVRPEWVFTFDDETYIHGK
mgnify:CR=1 FL=1